MENKLNMLIEMITGLSEKVSTMDDKIDLMQGDINELKQLRPIVESTQTHVAKLSEDMTIVRNHTANLDERLTFTQKKVLG